MLPLLPECQSRAPANGEEKSGSLTSGAALTLHLMGDPGSKWAVLGLIAFVTSL